MAIVKNFFDRAHYQIHGIKITEISFNSVLKIAAHPYNPPDPTTSLDRFEAEWHHCQEAVHRALETVGEGCEMGTKDYTISDTFCLARAIGVEITSEKMYCPQFILKTLSALYSVNYEYEVFASSTFPTDGQTTYVIINPHQVRVCAAKSVIQHLIGH